MLFLTFHPLAFARRCLVAPALLLAASSVVAQSTAVQPGAVSASAGVEQRSERIQHEDALTRVDELRVGGQTRSITVQPKNGAPGYEVTPLTGSEDPNATRNGSTGKSRWRLLDF